MKRVLNFVTNIVAHGKAVYNTMKGKITGYYKFNKSFYYLANESFIPIKSKNFYRKKLLKTIYIISCTLC